MKTSRQVAVIMFSVGLCLMALAFAFKFLLIGIENAQDIAVEYEDEKPVTQRVRIERDDDDLPPTVPLG